MDRTASTKWGLLRLGGHAEGGLEIPTIPLDVATAAGPVRMALGAKGEPRLLLPLAPADAPISIDGGDALSVSIVSFKYSGQILSFLDLICLNSDLETVFEEVVDEILARISHGNSCTDAAQSAIEDFRTLLTRAAGTAVAKGRVAGLIAELIVLNRLLDHSPRAWRAWAGPMGDRHDFRVGDASLEVKASLRSAGAVVTVNGLEQLEVPTGGSLHLLRIVLEPVRGGGLCVSSLARRAMLKADNPSRLGVLLAAAGCKDSDAKEWNRHNFRKEAEQLYDVREGFPRMTQTLLSEAAVSRAVHDVTYKVDLSVAETFLCDATVYRELEAKLCS